MLYSSDARVGRWKSRIERLSKYRDEAAKLTGYDAAADKLFSNEIKSAEEFISLLERYGSGDGSLKTETKKYTINEIESITSETAGPIVSVYYASEMIHATGNPLYKSALKDDINKYAAANGLPLLNKQSRETELLAQKYILQRYSSGYDEFRRRAISNILATTGYELSRTGYNSNDINLKEIIFRAAEKSVSTGINSESEFNNKHLTALAEWKEHELSSAEFDRKIKSACSFAEAHGITVTPEDKRKGFVHIEELIFSPQRGLIIMMSENTEKFPSTGYNNPLYEIPDFMEIKIALEDIDMYRQSLNRVINGTEDSGFMNKVKNNNRGIANRYLKKYDNLFKRERLRIAALKGQNSGVIIYNEEIFNVAEKHFTELKDKLLAYADLSSDFIDAIHSPGKIDPDEYLTRYKSKTEKNLEYMSFIERLTADALPAGNFAYTRINNLYRASAGELFATMKKLLVTEQVSPEVRKTMTKDHIKNHAGINDNLKVKGSALILSARKNYEAYSKSYTEAVAAKKESLAASEISIGQDEVDRLMSTAGSYSEYIASMGYTIQALKNYSEEYKKITGDIQAGKDLSQYLEKINSGTLIPLVDGFSPEKIDSEMKLRDMLIREGNESLSGASALTQYYSRRGYRLKYTHTAEEIAKIKTNFNTNPGVKILTWEMNGKNFRLIDTNTAASLKKLINRKAWTPASALEMEASKETFSLDDKITFTISVPSGWNRTEKQDDRKASISVAFKSPDLLGSILLRAIKFDNENIQIFSDEWNRACGFTPVSKEWGKKNGIEYLLSVSKNSHDRVMESYIIKKEGYVIHISGISDKNKYSSMNRNLKDIFSSLEI